MKFSEAMKLLEEGKKVRVVGWNEGECIQCIEGKEYVYDETGSFYEELSYNVQEEWEEYIEPKTKKIEALDYRIEEIVAHSEMEFVLIDSIKANKHKINEIIDKLNKLEG